MNSAAAMFVVDSQWDHRVCGRLMPEHHPLLQTPLAIVGMSCSLPGASGLSDFWDLLVAGRCAIGEMPSDRLDRSLYYSPAKGVRGATYSTLGGLIPPRNLSRVSSFLTPAELADVDPCHQLLCDVVIEACENAGFDARNFPLRNTGVYIGHSGGSSMGSEMAFASLAEETVDYLLDVPEFAVLDQQTSQAVRRETVQRLRSVRPRRGANGGPNLEANMAAAVVAKALRLNGPHFVIDAACASSLVALATAALALNQGQIDAALVGGASYNKADSLVLFSQAQSCSATGTRPFDDEADGLIGSEGYVALILKLLPRAIADGDKIQAVIRGIGLSSDGRGRSLWAPRKEGQYAAVQRAYGPGVTPEDIQFVEAHATSTQVGDATELEALGAFFGGAGRKIPIGSVKSNIGHTLETAGLAGLLKVVLAMQHRTIPPTVNLLHPNRKIPWGELPFTVPTSAQPWPEAVPGKLRCAAVNAFGIGGLNVHVVVEESVRSPANHAIGGKARPSAAPATERAQAEPIAVLGRGLIMPGAKSVAEWNELIRSERSALADAPASRWRKAIGVEPGSCRPWSSPTSRGGFILDYVYDWKTHKIPPKQVAQANPLQFMLLDAARQAIDEAGYRNRPYNQDTTAVVVGNIFGGEFGNQLTIGLRLPELRREITALLRGRGVSESQTRRIIEEYERLLLEAKPALLDETGSFTCSTLASRIAKTMNLMGGALAIDAGDCSSLAALSVASSLLQSRACGTVLCAAAQRAMDLPLFESLALHGRLAGRSGAGNDGYLPGEGVVVLFLKRLVDAERDGDRVITVIRGISGSSDAGDLSRAVAISSQRALAAANWQGTNVSRFERGYGVACLDSAEANGLAASYGFAPHDTCRSVVHQIGHTQAVHGFASLLKATVVSPAETVGITTHSSNGLAYHMLLSPSIIPQVKSSPSPVPDSMHSSVASASPRLLRFSAPTGFELANRMQNALADLGSAWDSRHEFASDDGTRLAIVAKTAEELRTKLTLAHQQWNCLDARPALHEQGIFLALQPPRTAPRIAFAFPGQGSQYPGMLEGLVALSPAARQVQQRADQLLHEQFGQTFSSMAWQDPARLGIDVWVTQMVMLVADCIAWAAIREMGVSPDCVTGHSFGEIAALVAAETISFEQGIEVTNARARAMDALGGQKFSMLAMDATPATLESLLAGARDRVFLSHHNAPAQTVVGGSEEAIVEFKAKLAAASIPACKLSVPTAYHTPLMQPTLGPWRDALAKAAFRPPRIPLLSSVTTKYVADPHDIRENLVHQMVRPIHYVDLVERLARDGIDVLLEVGPQQILTRLHRRILAGQSVTIAAIDHPKRSAAEQLCRVRAELECLGWKPDVGESSHVEVRIVPSKQTPDFEQFDATTQRKSRRRREATSEVTVARTLASLAPLESFDATSIRRARQRSKSPSGPGQCTPIPANDISAESANTASGVLSLSEHARSLVEISATTSTDGGQLEKFLVDFVVEQTGYPAELIDFDWDMEADLGIDSIKRAQLFGELREFFDLDTSDRASLGEYRTLRQVLDLLRSRTGKTEWLETKVIGPDDDARQRPETISQELIAEFQVTHEDSPASQTPKDGSRGDHFAIEQFLIDFVVEQTGYPREIVDLDADLEADLGIDSIKKAQLLGELREQFQLRVGESDQVSLSDYSTLRQVLDRLCQTPTAMANSAISRSSRVVSVVTHDSIAEEVRSEEYAPRPSATPAISGSAEFAAHSAPQDVTVSQGNRAPGTEPSSALRNHYELGFDRGRRQAQQIRTWLRLAADLPPTSAASEPRRGTMLTAEEWSELQGLADGAEVPIENVIAFQASPNANQEQATVLRLASHAPECSETAPANQNHADKAASVTHRYVLRMCPASYPSLPGVSPDWHGAAVILGDNELAKALQARFRSEGRSAYCIAPTDDPADAVRELEQIWARERAPHLFVVTARDPEAATSFQEPGWQRRRARGVMTPFWVCQKWIQLAAESGLLHEASLVGVTSLGGDFGFDGNVIAPESGAVTGLLKAILIECWVNGFRTIPIKLLDYPPSEPPAQIIADIWRELSVPSYDIEIGRQHGERAVVRAYKEPQEVRVPEGIRSGGVWVCTGGARGITAHVARELATRFNLRLHLLGVSPVPQIPAAWRQLSPEELRRLRLEIMQAARRTGGNPVKEWEKTEKALEIDRTLRDFEKLGISATYHSCDVSNRAALAEVMQQIRSCDGPIEGILHGAGVGKDARFERKDPKRVDECIRAKVDGAWALMEATKQDPLRYFVAFGSISGRFGANGHTDYSLANDMLCKQVAWFHRRRPEVKAVAFHWHAWGDVGMATKPETRLALEMVGMQFMPAQEGVNHLIRELEGPATESEILITDDRYYQLFFPAETLVSSPSASGGRVPELPLLGDALATETEGIKSWETTLDPVSAPFLVEHRLDDRPLLPIVIGLELLGEAAIKQAAEGELVGLRDVEPFHGLRFFTDRQVTVQVRAEPLEAHRYRCELVADFCARDGRLVEPHRLYLRGTADLAAERPVRRGTLQPPPHDNWEPVIYPPRGSKMYLGPVLNCLKKIIVGADRAWGKISAPALVELAGPQRSVAGWRVPSAALDACLFATGILCWQRVAAGPTLPARLGCVEFGRLPHPGEACVVETRFLRRDGRYAVFQFTLFGQGGDVLVDVTDYRVAWLVG